MCAEIATPEQLRPGLHAVEIKVQRSDLIGDQKLTEYADFVDTLWLAVPAELAGEAQGLVPPWVGVLAFQERQVPAYSPAPLASLEPARPQLPQLPQLLLQVVQPAGAIPRKADLRGELAFELLKRLL